MGRKHLVISQSEMPQKKGQEEDNKGQEVKVVLAEQLCYSLCGSQTKLPHPWHNTSNEHDSSVPVQ